MADHAHSTGAPGAEPRLPVPTPCEIEGALVALQGVSCGLAAYDSDHDPDGYFRELLWRQIDGAVETLDPLASPGAWAPVQREAVE